MRRLSNYLATATLALAISAFIVVAFPVATLAYILTKPEPGPP